MRSIVVATNSPEHRVRGGKPAAWCTIVLCTDEDSVLKISLIWASVIALMKNGDTSNNLTSRQRTAFAIPKFLL